MFQITKDGSVIGFCEEPTYVKDKDGIWVNCPEEEAEAIAFKSEAIEGAVATKIGTEIYVGDLIAGIEDALCELAMTIDEEENDGEDMEE